MSKSNTKSNKISLPNGCSCTGLTVTPSNWLTAEADTKMDWAVCYTFFDGEQKTRRQIRGMNGYKEVSARRAVAKGVIKQELERLHAGFNPIKGSNIVSSSDTGPDTPFISALWLGVNDIRGSKGHLISLQSVVRGVEKSARELGIHNMPIKSISRKHFNNIFKQCYINNTRFTGSTQNRYKKSLSRIYIELMNMEMVEFNPLHRMDKARVTKKTRAMPTEKERKKINTLKETNYYLWRAIQVFFTSGAREAELLRLREGAVNLKRQECTYTIEKGVEVRQGVKRPIPNSTLHLWKEIISECKPGDYLFSNGKRPGPKPIRREQLSRSWKRHVKDKMGINVDLYSLKHLFITETMETLDKKYNYDPAKDLMKSTAHTTDAMIIKLYDTNNKQRKNDKIKTEAGSF